MKPETRTQQGFTLIEVLIAVAIVSILAAIAYPNYKEYVDRGNRSEGQALLNDTAAAQERYYAQNFVYITANGDMGKLNTRTISSTEKYTLSIGTVADDGGYTLTANQQFNDSDCGNLTLNALGVRGITGSGKTSDECWR